MKRISSLVVLLCAGVLGALAQQTIFPSELGLGQTWNRSLLKRIGQIKGQEARLAGEQNMPLPAFKYGESPYLVAELGIEMAKGLYSSIPLTGIDRQPEQDVRFRAAFERIINDSGILEEKNYDAITGATPATAKKEQAAYEEAALQAFRESIVLLKNKDGLLPIIHKSKRLLMCRSYYEKEERSQVMADARKYDLIGMVWEADDANRSERNIWLKTLCALGKPVVLVLSGEESFAIDPLIESSVAAIFTAWSPQAVDPKLISEVVYGAYNPGSRLTAAIYDTTGKELFPEGYGLSYTKFAYSDLTVNPETTGEGKTVVVRFKVKNTGKRAGDEVARLYLQRTAGATMPADNVRLEAFKRTHLKPGEQKEIKFTIRRRNIVSVDEQMNRTLDSGEYSIVVGDGSLRKIEVIEL